MGWQTFQNVVILIGIALVTLAAIIIIILQAESNLTFWVLRPSEKAALDIVGRITALGGTTGNVEISYGSEMPDLEYYLMNSEKVTCIITKKIESGPYPVPGGMMTTINCYSSPFPINIPIQEGERVLEFDFEKTYDDGVKITIT